MENISTTVPTWQHPILPGQALQGNILVTKNDFKEPPQSQSNFEWVDIEDLCGVHDVKATVDTDKNIITLYKTGGHRNQDGTWVEDWIPYIEIQQLTKELVDILTNMLYIEYRFNIVNNDGDEDYSSINIQGVRKDGITIDDLGTFKTYSIKKLDEMFAESGASIEAEKTAREQADATLQTNIDKEKEDRNTEDDKLHTYLQQETNNRTNADKTLQDNIDSEKSSRETADTNLEKSLNNEKIDRAKADATLTTNLNTETTNRTTADTTLQTNIDNEKSARETAIKGLEDKIAKLPVSDSIYTKTETNALLLKKQDKLTAGDNITIDENNKISATGGGTTYTAGVTVTVVSDNKLSAKDTTYTAGDNITIDSDNKISAKDTTYTAGDNITIDSTNKISASGGGSIKVYNIWEGGITWNAFDINKSKKGVTIIKDGSSSTPSATGYFAVFKNTTLQTAFENACKEHTKGVTYTIKALPASNYENSSYVEYSVDESYYYYLSLDYLKSLTSDIKYYARGGLYVSVGYLGSDGNYHIPSNSAAYQFDKWNALGGSSTSTTLFTPKSKMGCWSITTPSTTGTLGTETWGLLFYIYNGITGSLLDPSSMISSFYDAFSSIMVIKNE